MYIAYFHFIPKVLTLGASLILCLLECVETVAWPSQQTEKQTGSVQHAASNYCKKVRKRADYAHSNNIKKVYIRVSCKRWQGQHFQPASNACYKPTPTQGLLRSRPSPYITTDIMATRRDYSKETDLDICGWIIIGNN